jgi:hypothetical protein
LLCSCGVAVARLALARDGMERAIDARGAVLPSGCIETLTHPTITRITCARGGIEGCIVRALVGVGVAVAREAGVGRRRVGRLPRLAVGQGEAPIACGPGRVVSAFAATCRVDRCRVPVAVLPGNDRGVAYSVHAILQRCLLGELEEAQLQEAGGDWRDPETGRVGKLDHRDLDARRCCCCGGRAVGCKVQGGPPADAVERRLEHGEVR